MKILVASKVDGDALEKLRARHQVTCAFNAPEEELIQRIPGHHALVFRSGVTISGPVLGAADALELIVRAGSGLDNIDRAELARRGIRLERIPGPSAQAVAELTFALMLSLARNLRQADALLRTGHWAKNELEGFLLSGKTLGVVGAGNIGRRVCEMGVAWGMRVVACVERWSHERASEFKDAGIELTRFDEVLPQADFLTLHVPLGPATRGLIDARALARMKQGAFLVNVARGGVVDEQALRVELGSGGRLRGAGLDTHEREGQGAKSPLADLPNVVLTPHVGASTVDTQREIGREILAIVEAFDAGRVRS
jgi:D-3-phosphoglycerate dehydrogenase